MDREHHGSAEPRRTAVERATLSRTNKRALRRETRDGRRGSLARSDDRCQQSVSRVVRVVRADSVDATLRGADGGQTRKGDAAPALPDIVAVEAVRAVAERDPRRRIA